MKNQLKNGDRVVRSVGDYVVGRTGEVVNIDMIKKRAQVKWDGEAKTWVRFEALELEAIPYEIIRFSEKDRKENGRIPYPQYKRI